jgi:hypothetical protein
VDSNHRLPDPESGNQNLGLTHEFWANLRKGGERGRFKRGESGEPPEEEVKHGDFVDQFNAAIPYAARSN